MQEVTNSAIFVLSCGHESKFLVNFGTDASVSRKFQHRLYERTCEYHYYHFLEASISVRQAQRHPFSDCAVRDMQQELHCMRADCVR